MSVSRTSVLSRRSKVIRAAVERLESRVLLTHFAGIDPQTGLETLGTGSADFRDAAGNAFRISYQNVIFDVVGSANQAAVLQGFAPAGGIGDLIGFVTPQQGATGVPGADPGLVYVTAAGSNSYISIVQVEPPTQGATVGGDPTPFGSATTLTGILLLQQSDQNTVSGPDGGGALYLGRRIPQVESGGEGDVPIPLFNIPSGIGNVPPGESNGGLIVANGQSLGSFLFDGAVTGNVEITGSMETFYGGWLVTGHILGQTLGGAQDPNNFVVDGDLRNLITRQIGTDDASLYDQILYNTGVDIEVGGKLGQIHSELDFLGRVHAANALFVPGSFGVYQEVEKHSTQVGTDFQSGRLGDADSFFWNDSFTTPQVLGSISTDGFRSNTVAVDGTLEGGNTGDNIDFYGVGLMAGQSYSVQLTGLNGTGTGVGVMDPTGRLIACDFVYPGQAIQFTADRPGLYRFAVTIIGDSGFTGSLNGGGLTYELHVGGAGNLGIGGVVADQSQVNVDPTASYQVDRGDLGFIGILSGAAAAAGSAVGDVASLNTTNDITVSDGNLRAVEAPGIAYLLNATTMTGFLHITVPNGSVGLIRGTDAAGPYSVVTTVPVGDDIQTLEGAGNFDAQVACNRAIGDIRAGSMTYVSPPTFTVNADGIGNDGVIDLIDVTGDMGTLGAGGPVITTGPGGNVRYIHVGGVAYRDMFFGGGEPAPITYDPGASAVISDDSGGIVTITPQQVRNPAYVPGTAGSLPFLPPAQLSVLTYPIRGSGGAVILSVDVSNPDDTGSGSIDIVGSGGALGASVEIGMISITGVGAAGQAITQSTDPITGRPELALDTTTGTPLDVNITGGAVVDVLSIDAPDMSFSSITNSTGGEIASINATSIGTLGSSGTVGLARRHTGAAVEPITVVSNTFPFSDQRIGIVVSGDIVEVHSGQGLGNLIVTGIIGAVHANNDEIDVPNVYEGINAPVFSAGGIYNVNIGEGLPSSGTGNFAFTGIYSTGPILTVTNQGLGSDIRGNIVSATSVTGTTTGETTAAAILPPVLLPTVPGIGEIRLNNGAIIGSRIMVASALSMSSLLEGLTIPDTGTIGQITTTGAGGIIGMTLYVTQLGAVNAGGFGMFDSYFGTIGVGQWGMVTAAGYGIRFCALNGANSVAGLDATGNGQTIPVTNFTPSARQSEVLPIDPEMGVQFDPLSGLQIYFDNDLHAFLGTSASAPDVPNVTDTGVIEDTWVTSTFNIGSVTAYRIRSRAVDAPPTNIIKNPGTPQAYYPMSLSAGGRIGTIRVRDIIDGLQVTAGRVQTFAPASDVFNFGMTIAGPINNMVLNGSLLGGSFINAIGPNGIIKSLRINGDLVGDVFASSKIGQMTVTGDLTGSVVVSGLHRSGQALGSLTIGGALQNGALTIQGNVGKIQSLGGLGTSGDQLQINGNLNQLVVGAASSVGTALAADVLVSGNMGAMTVNGQVTGAVTVQGNINRVTINANAANGPDAITGAGITGMRGLNRLTVTSGNLAANISAQRTIRNVQIIGANVNPGVSLTSQTGSINRMMVIGGSLLGSVLAPSGMIGNLLVDGNIGDGVTPLSITATRAGRLQTHGSVLPGVTATINGPLQWLIVDGNVESGATISAVPIHHRRIGGAVNGTIIG